MTAAKPLFHVRDGRRGFSLVELLIVVVVMAILAAIVIPRYDEATTDARLNMAITEFQNFEKAVRMFYAKNQRWPQDRGPGVYPPELAGYFDKEHFGWRPALGEVWDWNSTWGPATLQPNVSMYDNSNPPIRDWLALDVRFDDGDLNTGNIRFHGGTSLCYGVRP